MRFTLTGIVYLFVFITMSLVVNRFYLYWQKEQSQVSKAFFIFLAIFDLFFFTVAFGGLLFADNSGMLKNIVFASAFLQTLAGAVFGYLLFYLMLPKISPWVGFLGIFLLGLIGVLLTYQVDFYPTIEAFSINWNIPPLVGMFRYSVFLIPLLPYAIFCFNQARSPERDVRIRGLSVGSLLTLAILIAPLDFFLNKFLNFGAIGSDFAIGFIGLIFLVAAIIIPKPSKSAYVKKF